jgi:hypothetical protein
LNLSTFNNKFLNLSANNDSLLNHSRRSYAADSINHIFDNNTTTSSNNKNNNVHQLKASNSDDDLDSFPLRFRDLAVNQSEIPQNNDTSAWSTTSSRSDARW